MDESTVSREKLAPASDEMSGHLTDSTQAPTTGTVEKSKQEQPATASSTPPGNGKQTAWGTFNSHLQGFIDKLPETLARNLRNRRKWKDFLRSMVVVFVCVIYVVANKTLKTMGQAGYFSSESLRHHYIAKHQ